LSSHDRHFTDNDWAYVDELIRQSKLENFYARGFVGEREHYPDSELLRKHKEEVKNERLSKRNVPSDGLS
jgi:hypothetical protein